MSLSHYKALYIEMILENDKDVQEKQEKIADLVPVLESLERKLKRFYEENHPNSFSSMFTFLRRSLNENQFIILNIMVDMNDFEGTLKSIKELVINDYLKYEYKFF